MSIRIRQLLVSIALMTPASGASAAHVPPTLNLNGHLAAADGSSLTAPAVNFRVQVLDASDQCVLYEEVHPGLNLGASAGAFSLILGAGSGAVNNVSGSAGLDVPVFQNTGVTTVSNCGQPAVNLALGSGRHLRIAYDLGQGYVALTPDVTLTSGAYAMIADTLQGLSTTDFVQVDSTGSSGLTQTNAAYAFSATNWPRLRALVDGTSAQYLSNAPGTPINANGQRVVAVSDPTAAQDAVTKHYADTTFVGYPANLAGIGPATGDGSVLHWDATANQWTTGTISTTPTGSAGGALTGTYPNPQLANGAVTSTKISTTGTGPSRLLITDGTTGQSITFGTCAVGQVYAWTTGGWACTAVSALAPVTSVATRTGAVTLTNADIAGLGTVATLNFGTAANQIPRLDASALLPAVDGSLLTNVNAAKIGGSAVASVAPAPGQVLGWNASTTRWEPGTPSGGSVTSIGAGVGLLGGPIVTNGTLRVDVGSAAGQIVQENATAQIAQIPGTVANPGYAFVGDLDTGVREAGANQLQLITAGTAGLSLLANGNVGIGTTAPASRLEVRGAVVSRTNVMASGSTIDLSLANTHLVRSPGTGALTLQNPADGASYTIIVTDTATSRTYTFAGCTNQYFSPSNAATVVGSRTTYTLLIVNDGGNMDCYISWATGFM